MRRPGSACERESATHVERNQASEMMPDADASCFSSFLPPFFFVRSFLPPYLGFKRHGGFVCLNITQSIPRPDLIAVLEEGKGKGRKRKGGREGIGKSN
jgi:hypothetical protein